MKKIFEISKAIVSLLFFVVLFVTYSEKSSAASFAESAATLPNWYYSNTFLVQCNDVNTKYLAFRVQLTDANYNQQIITTVSAFNSVHSTVAMQVGTSSPLSPTAYRAGGPGDYYVSVTSRTLNNVAPGTINYKVQTWCMNANLVETSQNPVITNLQINSLN